MRIKVGYIKKIKVKVKGKPALGEIHIKGEEKK